MAFKPNSMTFAQGVERLMAAAKRANMPTREIITSRDQRVEKAVDRLKVTNVPSGFSKWQLPIYQDGPTQFFFSYGNPNTKVPAHSHDEGDGVRVIMHGSILYKGQELTAGDWMFIPKGKSYSFEVGRRGVGMMYCYQCCCA